MEVLQSNATGFQSKIPWGFPDPFLDPKAGKPGVGLRTFTKVGELLWYYYSPVWRSPTQQVRDLILLWLCPSYHPVAASSLVLGVGYLFVVVSSILLSMVVHQLVAILVLSQEEMSACSSIPPPWTQLAQVFFFYWQITKWNHKLKYACRPSRKSRMHETREWQHEESSI